MRGLYIYIYKYINIFAPLYIGGAIYILSSKMEVEGGRWTKEE